MSTLFVILFGAVSLVHLAGCFFRKPKLLAPVTKPLLMPLLLLCYLAISRNPSPFIIAGLCFATLGDTFLIGNSNRPLMLLGIGSFFLMQLSYIADFATRIGEPSTIMIVLGLICYGSMYGISAVFLVPFVPKKLIAPVLIYMLSIGSMGLMALLTFFTGFSNWMGLVLFGTGMFICSDFILCMEYFKEKTRYGHFIVMVTYLAAQFCIVIGLANLGG